MTNEGICGEFHDYFQQLFKSWSEFDLVRQLFSWFSSPWGDWSSWLQSLYNGGLNLGSVEKGYQWLIIWSILEAVIHVCLLAGNSLQSLDGTGNISRGVVKVPRKSKHGEDRINNFHPLRSWQIVCRLCSIVSYLLNRFVLTIQDNLHLVRTTIEKLTEKLCLSTW